MAKNNPFLTAQVKKKALTYQTSREIQMVYWSAYSSLEKRLATIKMLNPSDSLKKVYLEEFKKEANEVYNAARLKTVDIFNGASVKAGELAVEAGNAAMRSHGLVIDAAYSYIPKQQVENIVAGNLYKGKWTLSKAIWNADKKTQSDIQKIVASGLAENKPIKNIADDLTKYVDPTARKPWDWSKVYPGTAQQVDYNAQRLARTMIQHSFQASLVQSQIHNPFCRGILWHSVGLHGRTCELCLERDGNVFPVKDLPLDHPNGLCYFEPALDDMNDIADRLSDWVVGGNDPAIDEYIANGLGLNLKTAAGRQASRKAVEDTRRRSVIKPQPKPKSETRNLMKSSEYKLPKKERYAADAEVKAQAEKMAYTQRQMEAFDTWMMESDDINAFLRGEMDYWDKKITGIISDAMKAYKEEESVYRGMDGRLLGLKGNETAAEAKAKLVGRTRHEAGFMSTTKSEDIAKEFSQRAAYDELDTKSNVVMVLHIKGKKVAYVRSGLAEVLVDKNSKILFTDVVKKNGKFYVYGTVS